MGPSHRCTSIPDRSVRPADHDHVHDPHHRRRQWPECTRRPHRSPGRHQTQQAVRTLHHRCAGPTSAGRQPAASRHREPVRARDYPGPHARPRPATGPDPHTIHRTGESTPHAVPADPPPTTTPAPAFQRRTVTSADRNAERGRPPVFWERRHIHWLRLRPVR